MSSIFGLLHPDGRPVSDDGLPAMEAALDHWAADASGRWREGAVGLGHLMLHDTPESLDEAVPRLEPDAGLAITADARLDNRDVLAGALGLDAPTARALPDSGYILRAYEKWGRDCPAHLLGDFAFAIWDTSRRLLFCARDHVGIRPFYYVHTAGLFAFATEIKGLLAIPEVDRSIDEQWIADALLFIRPDRTSTFYRHIRRLEPAHTLVVTAEGLHVRRYWRLDPTRYHPARSEDEYVEAFREKLEHAVRVRTRSAFPVGAELSGGLDSSAVTALAHRLLSREGKPLSTFTDVLPPGFAEKDPLFRDEQPFAEALIAHATIEDAHFVNGEGVSLFDTLDWAARLYDQPPKKLLNVYLAPLFEAVRSQGVRTLLSGFGGDDMVTSHGRGYREDLLRRGAWRQLWVEVARSRRARWKTVPYLALLALREFLPDIHDVPFPYVGTGLREYRDAALHRFRRYAFRADYVDAEALERRYRRYRLSRARGTLNERLAQGIVHPHLLTERLENAALAAASFRFGYRYPLLDVPLMEYYLGLPTAMKHSGEWGRYIFRLSMEGLLPEAIRWRSDKSGSACPSSIFRTHRDQAALLEAFDRIPPGGLGAYVDLAYCGRYQRRVLQQQNPRETETFKLLLVDRIVRRAQEEGAYAPLPVDPH